MSECRDSRNAKRGQFHDALTPHPKVVPMNQLQAFITRRFSTATAAATLLLYTAAALAQAQTALPADTAPIGRIDFARVNLPPANVELDLSQGMFRDLFGIGDAAASGIAESLLKAADANRAAEG